MKLLLFSYLLFFWVYSSFYQISSSLYLINCGKNIKIPTYGLYSNFIKQTYTFLNLKMRGRVVIRILDHLIKKSIFNGMHKSRVKQYSNKEKQMNYKLCNKNILLIKLSLLKEIRPISICLGIEFSTHNSKRKLKTFLIILYLKYN